ncbi:hypothetical protein VTH06DRAFT_8786 [Thermothelomyces fergusii]
MSATTRTIPRRFLVDEQNGDGIPVVIASGMELSPSRAALPPLCSFRYSVSLTNHFDTRSLPVYASRKQTALHSKLCRS